METCILKGGVLAFLSRFGKKCANVSAVSTESNFSVIRNGF
jgi:hypothetical protein